MAYKIPDSTSFSFKTSQPLDTINKDTISNWEPLDRSEVILTGTFNVGIVGKNKKSESPFFYITIVTSKMVRLFDDKTRLFVIPYYESWDNLKQKIDEILVTNEYQSYNEFVRGISNYFEYEYEFEYTKQDKDHIIKR